jgi:two-component system, LuxR family, sensor kinase FixL
LKNPIPDLEEIRAILVDIRTDNHRAGEVIDRVRALLKRRELERGPLDLEQLTGEVFRLLRPDAESRQVRLMLTMASALPAVKGDRVRLQQVLLNLLLNAMDAVRANPAVNRLVTVRARHTGAAVKINVTDNGTGIPADHLPRLFTPFFTSKPSGLGMGLVISRSIIEEHGGQLSVHNEPAGGATFTIVLPVNGAAPVGKT